jgi:hypothetical protein
MMDNDTNVLSMGSRRRDWVFNDPQGQSRERWSEFRANFASVIAETYAEHLSWATWNRPKERTLFYATVVLPRLAQMFGLTSESELFRVDATLGVGMNREELVPIIHVEYENDVKSALYEIRKLCALGGQLKVLITCGPWDREKFPSAYVDCAEQYLEVWRARVKLHREMYPNDCTFGLIVGECAKGSLTYYETTLSKPYSDDSFIKGNVLLKDIPLPLSKTDSG